MHILLTIFYVTSWENLIKHQDISSLVIISFILVTCLFDQVVILQGEIRCLSLMGLKGLDMLTLTVLSSRSRASAKARKNFFWGGGWGGLFLPYSHLVVTSRWWICYLEKWKNKASQKRHKKYLDRTDIFAFKLCKHTHKEGCKMTGNQYFWPWITQLLSFQNSSDCWQKWETNGKKFSLTTILFSLKLML